MALLKKKKKKRYRRKRKKRGFDRLKAARVSRVSRVLTAAALMFLTVDRKASRLLVPLSLLTLAKMLHSRHIGFIQISSFWLQTMFMSTSKL